MPKNGLDSTKQKGRNDVILILVIGIMAGLCLIFVKMNQKQGAFVTVTVNGNIVETLPLSQDTTKQIISKDHYNVIEINSRIVRMQEADCPDKICVNHKPISSVGETIVCLPHKVVVEICAEQSEDNQKQFDAISK